MTTLAEAVEGTLLEKTVAEIVPVKFDFGPLFDDGVSVTLTFKATNVKTGVDVTASMKQGNPGLKPGTERTYSQLVKGGLAGESYYVAMHAVGSDTSEEDLIYILPVTDLRIG